MQQAVNSQVKKSGGITDMDEHSLRQVLLARYYLHLANERMKSESESAKFAAINLFHEALETTLFTCAAHLNAKVSERGGIENYIDGINAKIDGKELPLRRRILQFNKARVSAKHHLTLPEDNFFSIIRTTVPEFIQEAVNLTFCKDFYAVSLAELIEDSEVGSYISQAQADFSSGKYYDCLAEVRKAFYVQFEKQYDVRKFEDPEKAKARGLLSEFSICRAPYHAKNPEYIRDRVSRPSDFIDHSALGSELMREGIDVQTFWNIWRLTPGVYHEEDGQWTVEYDFDLADDQQIRENCIYVLEPDSKVSQA